MNGVLLPRGIEIHHQRATIGTGKLTTQYVANSTLELVFLGKHDDGVNTRVAGMMNCDANHPFPDHFEAVSQYLLLLQSLSSLLVVVLELIETYSNTMLASSMRLSLYPRVGA